MRDRLAPTARAITRALDHAPFTRRHRAFLAALLMALAFDYSKPVTISFIIPGIRELWDLSAVAASYLAVAGLLGNVVGAALWGFLADRIGRRTALLWTVGIFTVTSLCGLSMQYWHMLVACFLMGIGVGGEAPVVFALAAEYVPVKARARTLLFLGLIGSTAGYALAALIAAVSNGLFRADFAWRVMWLAGILPAALILVLRSRIVPESARYLLAHGRVEEARTAAESLIGPIEEVAAPEERPPKPAGDPRASRLYGRTLALAFFSFAWGLANFGFIMWLPTLLERIGYTGAASSTYLALSALIALPALPVTAWLLARSTRWTLVGYAVAGAFALVSLGFGTGAGWAAPLFLVAVGSLALFFITSIGAAFSLYAAEVFPTAIRAYRTGVVSAASKFGGVVGPYFGGLWLAGGGAAIGLLTPLAASLLIAAGILALAGVETRGRTLEQIDGD